MPEALAQLETAKTQNQARIEAADRAAEELKAAELAKDRADELAVESERKLSPVSVFVSRKMQRFYVRQANLPVMEGLRRSRTRTTPSARTSTRRSTTRTRVRRKMRWSVVSLYKSIADMPKQAAPDVKPNDKPPPQRRQSRGEAVSGRREGCDRCARPHQPARGCQAAYRRADGTRLVADHLRRVSKYRDG